MQQKTSRRWCDVFLKAFEMKKVLTIAGSDCSGGAGIQADLKTMAANGVYGMSAVMALTAQNTTGVQGIMEVTPEFAGQQIDSIFTDIRPDAVKIGMLSSGEIIHVVAEKLKEYQAEHIVLDPVMVSTSGHRLIQKDAEQSLKKELFPLAELITPNIPEAECLAEGRLKMHRIWSQQRKDCRGVWLCSFIERWSSDQRCK